MIPKLIFSILIFLSLFVIILIDILMMMIITYNDIGGFNVCLNVYNQYMYRYHDGIPFQKYINI